jgi:ribosome-binding factor A
METTRQQKIERMLQKELGEIFVLYARQIHGAIITVTNIRISADLSIARIHLSIFPGKKQNDILEKINKNNKALRYELGRRVKNQLRIIPEIFFHIDDSLDYLENIDRLLKTDPPSPLSESEEETVSE